MSIQNFYCCLLCSGICIWRTLVQPEVTGVGTPLKVSTGWEAGDASKQVMTTGYLWQPPPVALVWPNVLGVRTLEFLWYEGIVNFWRCANGVVVYILTRTTFGNAYWNVCKSRVWGLGYASKLTVEGMDEARLGAHYPILFSLVCFKFSMIERFNF